MAFYPNGFPSEWHRYSGNFISSTEGFPTQCIQTGLSPFITSLDSSWPTQVPQFAPQASQGLGQSYVVQPSSISLSPLNVVGQTPMPRYPPQPLPAANVFPPQSTTIFQSASPNLTTSQTLSSHTTTSWVPSRIVATSQPTASKGLDSARSVSSNSGTPRLDTYTIQAAKLGTANGQSYVQRRSSVTTSLAGPQSSSQWRSHSVPQRVVSAPSPSDVTFPTLAEWQAAANFTSVPVQSNFTFYRILSTDGAGLDQFMSTPEASSSGFCPPVNPPGSVAGSVKPPEAGHRPQHQISQTQETFVPRLQEPQSWAFVREASDSSSITGEFVRELSGHETFRPTPSPPAPYVLPALLPCLVVRPFVMFDGACNFPENFAKDIRPPAPTIPASTGVAVPSVPPLPLPHAPARRSPITTSVQLTPSLSPGVSSPPGNTLEPVAQPVAQPGPTSPFTVAAPSPPPTVAPERVAGPSPATLLGNSQSALCPPPPMPSPDRISASTHSLPISLPLEDKTTDQLDSHSGLDSPTGPSFSLDHLPGSIIREMTITGTENQTELDAPHISVAPTQQDCPASKTAEEGPTPQGEEPKAPAEATAPMVVSSPTSVDRPKRLQVRTDSETLEGKLQVNFGPLPVSPMSSPCSSRTMSSPSSSRGSILKNHDHPHKHNRHTQIAEQSADAQEDQIRCRAMLQASSAGHIEAVRGLLSSGVQPDCNDKDGRTPLYMATQNGHRDVVDLLIKAKANVDFARKNGCTALYIAAQKGHFDIVRDLLSAGAQVSQAQNEGYIALHYASQHGHLEVVKALVEAGSNVEKVQSTGYTPLHFAVGYGHTDIVTFLVEAHADINRPENGGLSPLCISAYRGNAQMVSLLLSLKAEVDKAENNGLIPLAIASHGGHNSVVSLLLQAGAAVNRADSEGFTSLSLAAMGGYVDVVRQLLDANADPLHTNNQGDTPIRLASQANHRDVVRLLKSATGVEPSPRS